MQVCTQPKGLASEVTCIISVYSVSKNAVSFPHLSSESFGICNVTVSPGRDENDYFGKQKQVSASKNTKSSQMFIGRETVNPIPPFYGILDHNKRVSYIPHAFFPLTRLSLAL